MIQRLFAAHDLHLLDELATGQIAQFLEHVAALQLLTMGAPKALPEGPRQAGIGQRRGCPTALIHQERLHPAAGPIFLRKTLLHLRGRAIPASLRLALHPKNGTLYPVQLPDLG